MRYIVTDTAAAGALCMAAAQAPKRLPPLINADVAASNGVFEASEVSRSISGGPTTRGAAGEPSLVRFAGLGPCKPAATRRQGDCCGLRAV